MTKKIRCTEPYLLYNMVDRFDTARFIFVIQFSFHNGACLKLRMLMGIIKTFYLSVTDISVENEDVNDTYIQGINNTNACKLDY